LLIRLEKVGALVVGCFSSGSFAEESRLFRPEKIELPFAVVEVVDSVGFENKDTESDFVSEGLLLPNNKEGVVAESVAVFPKRDADESAGLLPKIEDTESTGLLNKELVVVSVGEDFGASEAVTLEPNLKVGAMLLS